MKRDPMYLFDLSQKYSKSNNQIHHGSFEEILLFLENTEAEKKAFRTIKFTPTFPFVDNNL